MNQEWQIAAPADGCGACARAFAEAEGFMSCLTVAPEEGYRREDFCDACWGARAPDAPVSVWRNVWRAPAPKPEEPLKKETAESLLRQLVEVYDPAQAEVIFVLAVMLERKRIFVEREVQRKEDGAKIRVYEHRQTKETFVIQDPQLKLTELEPVQRRVMELLGAPAPAGVAATNGAPPPTGATAPAEVSDGSAEAPT